MQKAELDRFIERYVAMWHEPDVARRRRAVEELWAADAENLTGSQAARGHAEIEARVTRAHDEWVAEKGFVFRPTSNSDTHHHLVKLVWEMVPRDGGPAAARGLDLFVLAEDGRIRALYQFGEPLPA